MQNIRLCSKLFLDAKDFDFLVALEKCFKVHASYLCSKKLSERPSTKTPLELADSLDRILHNVTNNQQVVFGRLELLLERDDIDDQTKQELEQVFRAVEENNDLITQVKKKVNEMREV